jgi:superfamily II DNA helicase RecQ
MPLQYRFFIIPAKDIPDAESELNRFLRSVRIVNVQRDFVGHGENSFWGLAVEYLPADGKAPGAKAEDRRQSKVDYKEVLAPQAFALFARLRDWRKETASQEAVPVYTIFTNEQLAHIAEKRISTKAGLQEIDGVGDARIKRYAEAVISIVTSFNANTGNANEAEGPPLPSDPNA